MRIFYKYTCSNCKISLKGSEFSEEIKQVKGNVLQTIGDWLWKIQIRVSSPPPLKNRLNLKVYWSPNNKECKSVSTL